MNTHTHIDCKYRVSVDMMTYIRNKQAAKMNAGTASSMTAVTVNKQRHDNRHIYHEKIK